MVLKKGSKRSHWSWDKPVKAFIWRSSRICRPIGRLLPGFFEESLPHLLLRNNSITSAGLDDGAAAPIVLGHVTPQDFPRLSTIFADQKDHNHALDAWMAEHRTGWHIEVKRRPAGTKGFTPLEKRWVIERTHAWPGRYRRNSKDDERSTESRTAMIRISHIHLMPKRRSPCGRPAFHYRKEAA